MVKPAPVHESELVVNPCVPANVMDPTPMEIESASSSPLIVRVEPFRFMVMAFHTTPGVAIVKAAAGIVKVLPVVTTVPAV